MMTIESFLAAHSDLVFSYTYAGLSPMPDHGGNLMDEWSVAFKRNSHRFKTSFYKGVGHDGIPPTAAEALDSLANDARAVQFDGNFQTITLRDFMADMGYENEKQAGTVFRKIIDNSQRLATLFTPQEFQTLLYETESL